MKKALALGKLSKALNPAPLAGLKLAWSSSSIVKGMGSFIKITTRVARGLMTGTKAFLSFANGVRRFTFSVSGVLTILELLLLFGDKIPIVAAGLDRLKAAFTGFFSELGKVGSLATKGLGPLLSLAFDAFSAGQSGIGFDAIIASVEGLIDLVGSQLVAAWGRVREALGPIYTFVNTLIVSVSETIDLLFQGIGSAISQVSGSLGNLANSLSSGEGQSMFVKIGQTMTELPLHLAYWLDRLIIEYNLS